MTPDYKGIVSEEDFCQNVSEMVGEGRADQNTDNYGQIIIYTGFYRWADGDIRMYEEEQHDDAIAAAVELAHDNG